MTPFILLAAAMAAGALLFVVPALLGLKHAARPHALPQTETSLAVLREQLSELESDRAAGRVTAADYARARAELEQRALREGRAARDEADTRPARRWAAAIVLLLPLTAAALYGVLGAPAGIETGNAGADVSEHDAPGQMTELLAQLTQRLAANPADPAGWTMLAHTYVTLGDFAGAAAAWKRIGANAPNDPIVLADWADILATATDGDFAGEPDRLIGQVLTRDPDNVKGLALAGASAFLRHDFKAATRYWERILPQLDPGDPAYLQLQSNLDQARQKTGLTPAIPPPGAATAPDTASPAANHALTLRGVVDIAPALQARIDPDHTVFIFIRPAQGGAPIAALRLSARSLPAPFDFANAPRMQDGPLPDRVTLGARLSLTADPLAQSGDLESATLTVMPNATGIVLNLDRIRP